MGSRHKSHRTLFYFVQKSSDAALRKTQNMGGGRKFEEGGQLFSGGVSNLKRMGTFFAPPHENSCTEKPVAALDPYRFP